MSDDDTADDIDAIRQRKLEELKEKAERGTLGEDAGDGDGGGKGGGDGDDGVTAAGEVSGTPDEPIQFGGGSLGDVVGEYRLALVDFYADWCGPCRMMEPTIDRIAANTDAAVVKVDADRHQRVVQQYGVQGLPTLILFKDGDPAERLVGGQTEGALRKAIRRHA